MQRGEIGETGRSRSVLLTYFAPVYVEVDMETGDLDRVVVGDEAATPATTGVGAHPGVREALAIAEKANWPDWEVGSAPRLKRTIRILEAEVEQLSEKVKRLEVLPV